MAEIKHFIDAEKLRNDTSFSDTDLTTPMMEQAALYAYYAHQAALAGKQVDDVKLTLELMSSKIDKEIRDKAAVDGEKLTEAKIDKMIHRDARYVRLQQKLNEAKMVESLTKSSLEALKQRRDMLVQIGVTMREEMKGELRLREIDGKGAASEDKRQRALATVGGGKK